MNICTKYINYKLHKIFKGLKQTHIIHLNEKPSAIVTVYTDNSDQHIPCKTLFSNIIKISYCVSLRM
jgi:hypothetical protein